MSKFHTIPGPFGSVLVRESEGEGPPIVFLHGNSSSSRAFERQLDGDLGKRRRLLAFDFMGFGDSGRADDPKGYLLSGQARTLVAVAEALGYAEAVFAGWSLGGHILLEAAPDLPKAKGFCIFGTPPIGFPPAMDKAFLPNPAIGLAFTPELSREQAHDFTDTFFAPGFLDIADFFVEDVLKADGRARAQVYASLDPALMRDEVEVCAALTQPLAILHGERERLINAAYFADLALPTLWRGAVQTIEGAGTRRNGRRPLRSTGWSRHSRGIAEGERSPALPKALPCPVIARAAWRSRDAAAPKAAIGPSARASPAALDPESADHTAAGSPRLRLACRRGLS